MLDYLLIGPVNLVADASRVPQGLLVPSSLPRLPAILSPPAQVLSSFKLVPQTVQDYTVSYFQSASSSLSPSDAQQSGARIEDTGTEHTQRVADIWQTSRAVHIHQTTLDSSIKQASVVSCSSYAGRAMNSCVPRGDTANASLAGAGSGRKDSAVSRIGNLAICTKPGVGR